ncbi:MAG: ATP-binding protein [Gammaproteobacteria bacterium]
MFSQSILQINKGINGLTIDAVKNPFLLITLTITNNNFVSAIDKAELELESTLDLIMKYNYRIHAMTTTQQQNWRERSKLSATDLDDMLDMPRTAVYEIFRQNKRELIRNAIGAGASHIEIGYLRMRNLGVFLIQDDGKKGFSTLRKGEAVDYLLMVGEESQQIDSDKKKRQSDGGNGRGLIQLARSLRLCQGTLYVSSNVSTGACIMLTAPISAPIPKNLVEIKAEFSCYLNMEHNQSAITKTMLAKFQLPTVTQPITPRGSIRNSSGSILSSLWNSFTEVFSTTDPDPTLQPTIQSISTFDPSKAGSLEEPLTPPSLVRPGDQIQVDEMIECYDDEKIKMITNYNTQQTLELDEKGYLKRLINYNEPKTVSTYFTNKPILHKTYLSQVYRKEIEYTECQLRTHCMFHHTGLKTLITYNDDGQKTNEVKHDENSSMCRIM